MKAIILTKFGPPEVLQLQEVEKPAPGDDEVLVRIRATTVIAGDCEMRSMNFPLYLSLPMRIWLGSRKRKGLIIPGSELAGVVEAAGRNVSQFKAGDQVFGSAGLRFGTNAEYICLPEKAGEIGEALAIMPTNMTYEQAAAVPLGGRDALHFLRKGDIRRGQKVLINGAGGSIGTFAVQLARYFGAEVTAVDSTPKLEMLRSIGADHVIDYTREDFTRNGERYDVIFDVAGKISLWRSKASIRPGGTYLLANPGLPQLVSGLWTRLAGSAEVVMQPASGTPEDLTFLKGLIEAGVIKSVIDRRYPLEQIIDAHRYVETGQKQGSVVIIIEDSKL